MTLFLPAAVILLSATTVQAANWPVGWEIQPPWEINTQALLPSFLLQIPTPLALSGEEFLVAQGKFGSDTSGDAITPPLPPSAATRILCFKYAKVGAAELLVLLKENESFRLIDSVTEQTGGRWTERTTVLPAGTDEQQLFFRARGILDGLDAVAISSVEIRSSSSSVLSPSKEIRRKPLLQPNRTRVCEVIQCSFHKSSCLWTFTGFTPLDGKVVATEGGVLSSEPLIQPGNAHFQMEIFANDGASATVHQRLGPDEQLLWTAGGVTLPGWNIVRLPLRFSSLPSKILVRAASTRGGYVAVRNTRLVDEFGNDLSCGLNVPVIRPRNDGLIRLTAMQKLAPNDAAQPITPTQVSRAVQPPPFNSFVAASFSTSTLSPSTSLQPVVAPSRKLFSPPETPSFMKNVDVAKWKSAAKLLGIGDKAITPVNTQEKVKLPPSLTAGLPPALQKAFSDKLSQFIELPPVTSSRESRPFSRQMDWVVQHAFNAFMNQARP